MPKIPRARGRLLATALLSVIAIGASRRRVPGGGHQPRRRRQAPARGPAGAEIIYPDEHLIVAQPSPSEVNPSFLGPVLLMKSAMVDLEAGTATLPLREGQLASGEKVWSILTDVTDENLANLHGVNYSAKMAYGITGKGARKGKFEKDGSFTFETGKVDFSPKMGIDARRCAELLPAEVRAARRDRRCGLLAAGRPRQRQERRLQHAHGGVQRLR